MIDAVSLTPLVKTTPNTTSIELEVIKTTLKITVCCSRKYTYSQFCKAPKTVLKTCKQCSERCLNVQQKL